VTFSSIYGLRTIELNRPNKLNSLNGSMARKVVARLLEYQKSDLANVIVMRGAGRALCAGGDVAQLAEWNKQGPEGQEKSKEYFALEYNLDHLIATLAKPYVSYMDGITMGGGVGLSVHAPFRIATENTVFAMPETTIGFFPEVGGTFFLPRMDGELGTYLALTSEQVRGVDVFYHGIATHFVHSTYLDPLSQRLAELEFKDHSSLDERYKLIAETIAEFDSTLPADRPAISVPVRAHIDACFSANTPQEILTRLAAAEASAPSTEVREWATRTAEALRARSPTSIAVTLAALRRGRAWTIAQAFRNEHAIAARFMRHPDFVTGVVARLVERSKARPAWAPDQIEGLVGEEVGEFFAECVEAGRPLPKDALRLMDAGTKQDYAEYPHRWLGLPSEADVLAKFTPGKTPEAVVKEFVKERDGKLGVKQKVEQVVELHNMRQAL
jgi:3-hydroxyisobutyryl-CoA hydrolase